MLCSDYARLYVARRDASPGYLGQLEAAIAALERYVGRHLDLADLAEPLLNGYLVATKGILAPETRRNRRNMVVRIWRHAAADPLLPDRPPLPDTAALGLVRVHQAAVRAWTPEQVRWLLEAASAGGGQYGGGFQKAAYWRSWILASWDLGWRGCDMRTFPAAAVAERITIVQVKTSRLVHGRLRQPALDAIREILGHDRRELVWPLWCNIETWRTIARRLVRRAGLPGSIGWLRRSAATACELAHPGAGYQFLGNTPDVFYAHYFDRGQGDVPQPPPLF